MEEDTSVPSDRLAFNVPAGRLVILRSAAHPTQRLILLGLLELTERYFHDTAGVSPSHVAELSYRVVAELVGWSPRTIAEHVPRLALAGWYRLELQGGPRPSKLEWLKEGPMAGAWIKLGGVKGVAPPIRTGTS